MADPNTIYKLTILYLLRLHQAPLSNTQISDFFLDHDYTDYFTVQTTLSDLTASDLITA